MFQRLKNFFFHGMLASDEQLGIKNPIKERLEKIEKENKDKEPVKMDKEDRKAFMIAARQVILPIVVVLILVVILLIYITARYF